MKTTNTMDSQDGATAYTFTNTTPIDMVIEETRPKTASPPSPNHDQLVAANSLVELADVVDSEQKKKETQRAINRAYKAKSEAKKRNTLQFGTPEEKGQK